MDGGLEAISDNGVSSWLIESKPINPRSGYDFQNNEVIFCTDNWTLAFREGLERFISFYGFGGAPHLFARRENEFYSFVSNQAWKHNSTVTYQIYEQDQGV